MTLLAYRLVEAELAQVVECTRELAQGDGAGLGEVLALVLDRPGKQLRPTLTLVAGLFHDYTPSLLVPMAAGVELLHDATLVHDDTIDQAEVRRGRPTINSAWSDHTAVLVGDYLLANAAKLVASTRNLRVIEVFAETLRVICDGEIRQDLSAFELAPSRERYFQRISSKTAHLFASAAEGGAVLSQTPEEAVQALRSYGIYLGMAFQVVDDILDFTATPGQLGKPAGSDLLHGTMTLPTILFLEQGGDEALIRQAWEPPTSWERVNQAVEAIRGSPAIESSFAVAQELTEQARQHLQTLPATPPRRALEELTDYVVQRPC